MTISLHVNFLNVKTKKGVCIFIPFKKFLLKYLNYNSIKKYISINLYSGFWDK